MLRGVGKRRASASGRSACAIAAWVGERRLDGCKGPVFAPTPGQMIERPAQEQRTRGFWRRVARRISAAATTPPTAVKGSIPPIAKMKTGRGKSSATKVGRQPWQTPSSEPCEQERAPEGGRSPTPITHSARVASQGASVKHRQPHMRLPLFLIRSMSISAFAACSTPRRLLRCRVSQGLACPKPHCLSWQRCGPHATNR